MKKTLCSAAALLTVISAQADTISQWTFEINTPADLSNSATSPSVAADVGTGTATGVHATAGSDWTTPAGNGSANSLSANEWLPGDYFQFQISSTGFSDLSVSYDQTSSGTGPGRFNFSYSTDGSLFTDFAVNYTVLQNGGAPNPSWNATTPSAVYSFSYNLSSITALNDQTTVYFRIVDANTTSASGGAVGTGGTDRIDNFTVAGTPIPVPEPTTYALLGLGGLAAACWRRRKA